MSTFEKSAGIGAAESSTSAARRAGHAHVEGACSAGAAGSPATSLVRGADSEDAPGVFDVAALLRLLMHRGAPQLTAAELRWMSTGCSSNAGLMAEHAAQLANGIACLVMNDGHVADTRTSAASGNFQSAHDVPDLLRHFSEVLTCVAGLVEASEDAQIHLWNRLKAEEAASGIALFGRGAQA